MEHPLESRKYKYKELKNQQEIRLLGLEPGVISEEVIQCRLRHALLSENPCYEALSYVWGDALLTRTILCNDKEIDITENLYTALRNLRNDIRHEKKARIIWC